jgi:hypothetical protein
MNIFNQVSFLQSLMASTSGLAKSLVTYAPVGSIPWRPSQWGSLPTNDLKQLIYMRSNIGVQGNDGNVVQTIPTTITGAGAGENEDPVIGGGGVDYANTKAYFFDAILREDHTTQRRITEHPVQSGANINDYSYQMPARLILEIGMSDAMATLIAGQFGSAPVSGSGLIGAAQSIANTLVGSKITTAQSIYRTLNGGQPSKTKSQNAYDTLLKLQKDGSLLTIQTRLHRYTNMVIEEIGANDDYKTCYGLNAIVHFKEVIICDVVTATENGLEYASGATTAVVGE